MLMQVAIKEFNKLYPRRCLVYEKKQLTKSQKFAAAANWFYAPRWSGNMFSERQAEQTCNFPEYCQELCKYTNNNPLQHRRARWMMMRSCPAGPSPPSKNQTERLRRERRVVSVLFARRRKRTRWFPWTSPDMNGMTRSFIPCTYDVPGFRMDLT